MTALVARSISGGAASGFAMLAGLICGDVAYLTAAVFGLAVIAQTYTDVFWIIRLASSLYLLWLAIQFWRYEPETLRVDPLVTRQTLAASWLAGFTITLGNPKTIAFYLALVPVVISLDRVTVAAWAGLLVPTTILVLSSVGGAFVLASAKARTMLRSDLAQRVIFRTASIVMAVAAIAIVTNGF